MGNKKPHTIDFIIGHWEWNGNLVERDDLSSKLQLLAEAYNALVEYLNKQSEKGE